MQLQYDDTPEIHCGNCGKTPATLDPLSSTKTKWYPTETGNICFRCYQLFLKRKERARIKAEEPEKYAATLATDKVRAKKRRKLIDHSVKGRIQNVYGRTKHKVLKNPKNDWWLKISDLRTPEMMAQFMPLFEAWEASGWNHKYRPQLTLDGYHSTRDRHQGFLWHRKGVRWTTPDLIRKQAKREKQRPVAEEKKQQFIPRPRKGAEYGSGYLGKGMMERYREKKAEREAALRAQGET